MREVPPHPAASPPPVPVVIRVEPVAAAMLKIRDAVVAELECVGAPVCRADVIASDRPTQVGGDASGSGGQGRVWVREVRESQPVPSCGRMTVQVEIGVIRCHVPVEGKNALTGENTVESEMWRVHGDKYAVRAALGAVRFEGSNRLVLSEWRPYGPQGNVVGGIWSVTWGMW